MNKRIFLVQIVVDGNLIQDTTLESYNIHDDLLSLMESDYPFSYVTLVDEQEPPKDARMTRYVVEAHNGPDTDEADRAPDFTYPPFLIFDIAAQDYMAARYPDRTTAEHDCKRMNAAMKLPEASIDGEPFMGYGLTSDARPGAVYGVNRVEREVAL